MADRVYLFDTTLRDGAQTQGVDFTVSDKLAIARELDRLGVDYIEGGWPGANPTDDAFFAEPPRLERARFTAFGMTRRPGRSAANDPGLQAVLGARAAAFCLVGKTWDFHVELALGVSPEENLQLIRDSVAAAGARGEALFDCEHFFDGYKANPAFALACARAAHEAGARWVVLCDTNGGTLPHEVEAIVAEVARHVPGSNLGIHAHNDTENAVANSLAAVRAGARMIQGTLNGLGERCGNANLCSIIPTLKLKLGYDIGIDDAGLARLTAVSRMLDDRLNRTPNRYAPYVGPSAFAHKGGLHVSAVEKEIQRLDDSADGGWLKTYEHVAPYAVGNRRVVVVSDQAGRANILSRLRDLRIAIDPKDPRVDRLVEQVKQRDAEGYAYDNAEASFELMVRRALGQLDEHQFFEVPKYRVIEDHRLEGGDQVVTPSDALVRVRVGEDERLSAGEGRGPVDALDHALRSALLEFFPGLRGVGLVDYKVRILTPQGGTEAVTRVWIESRGADGALWRTVGVSENIIEASFQALRDSYNFKLCRDGLAA
ncbi:MAG TPA: citramalate synthase [Alphaproteobacteria bacterium]|nr:citramalate synthase [Alphaproteobacteria bacterium]